MALNNMRTGTCRYCNRRIFWIRMASGKNMPVDQELYNYENGQGQDKIVTPNGEVVSGKIVSGKPGDGVGYKSHFASCPAACQARKRK